MTTAWYVQDDKVLCMLCLTSVRLTFSMLVLVRPSPEIRPSPQIYRCRNSWKLPNCDVITGQVPFLTLNKQHQSTQENL